MRRARVVVLLSAALLVAATLAIRHVRDPGECSALGSGVVASSSRLSWRVFHLPESVESPVQISPSRLIEVAEVKTISAQAAEAASLRAAIASLCVGRAEPDGAVGDFRWGLQAIDANGQVLGSLYFERNYINAPQRAIVNGLPVSVNRNAGLKDLKALALGQ